jgi:hypothetical protein
MNDDDPADDGQDWLEISSAGRSGGRFDLLRGDALVTLALVTFDEMRTGTTKGVDAATAELRKMIADDPDQAGLVYLLVVEKAMRIMGEAAEAGLEPLQHWRQRQLQLADATLRVRESLERGEIPEDILETEERLRRERAARDAADRDDEDGAAPDDDAGPPES